MFPVVQLSVVGCCVRLHEGHVQHLICHSAQTRLATFKSPVVQETREYEEANRTCLSFTMTLNVTNKFRRARKARQRLMGGFISESSTQVLGESLLRPVLQVDRESSSAVSCEELGCFPLQGQDVWWCPQTADSLYSSEEPPYWPNPFEVRTEYSCHQCVWARTRWL